MRRKVSLYISDKRVDLDDESFILFNYSYEDLDNPTIVKNSFSQQITLKGTPQNNIVFNDAFRLDRISSDGFNPREKTPFAIYDEKNNLLESGYVKLDSVKKTRNNAEYKISLFGGLGSFLYDLSYDENGDKRTLADLDFLGTQTPSSEFTYAINRTLVANAWDRLSGQSQIQMFDVLNFAPCYEGLPEDFSADKAVFDATSVEVYSDALFVANLSKSYTGMEAHDLRSYLLRPVIRFKSILNGINRFATSKGYTFTIDQNWADEQNADYENLWMTLPLLSGFRSGDTFTKADLMSGTDSPADYLLSYCKTFGLKLICEDKSIRLLERDQYFTNSVNDLSKRVDAKEMEITPIIFSSKWYEMKSENSGEFAKTYNETYGKTYGAQRINTGYAFDASVNEITDSIVFKGATQSQEKSPSFRDGFRQGSEDTLKFPSIFFDGGTYTAVNGAGESTEANLIGGHLSYTWWDETNKGYDKTDLPQMHESENKGVDGGNVLLYFTGMASCSSQMQLTDDIPTKMEDAPCWNLSNTNSRSLTTIPHFSRFITSNGAITKSLEWGDAIELNILNLTYGDNSGIYARKWMSYIRDRFNENTKKVTIKVDFTGIQVSADLLRKFYWFGGSVWMLNKITNYSLTTYDPVECEFIQIQDTSNYLNGQI